MVTGVADVNWQMEKSKFTVPEESEKLPLLTLVVPKLTVPPLTVNEVVEVMFVAVPAETVPAVKVRFEPTDKRSLNVHPPPVPLKVTELERATLFVAMVLPVDVELKVIKPVVDHVKLLAVLEKLPLIAKVGDVPFTKLGAPVPEAVKFLQVSAPVQVTV